MDIEGVNEDLQLGIILLILIVLGVGGYYLYKFLNADTADSAGDTSFISKAADNLLSIDSTATKQGYGPTFSQAAIEVATHPWNSFKSIVGWD